MDEIPVGGIYPYDPDSKWIKKAPELPPDTLNMAYVDTPELSPLDYIQIIDESGGDAANIYTDSARKKIMWSGLDGCLEDDDGDQLIEDEYPTLTDQFYYDDVDVEDMLPYVHRSRYYHLDSSGLATDSDGTSSYPYYGRRIALTSEGGDEYPGKFWVRLCKIENVENSDQSYYRVLLYIDEVPDVTYYLSYHKIEEGGEGEDTGWREIIAPQSAFSRSFDLIEVLDEENAGKELFYFETSGVSSPAGSIMGEGGRAFVTKKAKPDPRRYQFFQWRVKGEYTIEIDKEKNVNLGAISQINVGYLVFGKRTHAVSDSMFLSDSQNPDYYCFYNLQNWAGNPGVIFSNPYAYMNGSSWRKSRNYWLADLDKLSESAIKQYDVLVFSTHIIDDATNKLKSGKYRRLIDAFLSSGGILLIEECGGGRISWDEASSSSPVLYKEGCWTTSDTSDAPVAMGVYDGDDLDNGVTVLYDPESNPGDLLNYLVDARTWGGYEITDEEAMRLGDKFHPYWAEVFTTGAGLDDTRVGCIPYLDGVGGSGWTKIIGKTAGKPTIAVKRYSKKRGMVILSTMDILCGCNDIWAEYDSDNNKQLHWLNCSPYAQAGGSPENDSHPLGDNIIGYLQLFGAASFQMLYNICLLACANRKSSEEKIDGKVTTRATVYTPWKPSWVINESVLIEHPEPNEKKQYYFFPYAEESWDVGSTPASPVLARAIAASGWGEDGVPLSPTIGQLMQKALPEGIKSNPNRWSAVYTLEVTNEKVLVPEPEVLTQNHIPVAWTFASSPEFDYPPHYKVKSREIMSAEEGYQSTYKSIQDVTRSFQFRMRGLVQDPDELGTYSWETLGVANTLYNDEDMTYRVSDVKTGSIDDYPSGSQRPGYKFNGMVTRAVYGNTNHNTVRWAQDALNHMIWLTENPWTPPSGKTYCPVNGNFDATTKEFIAKWENDRFTAGMRKSDGEEIDAPFFESILNNLVVTNEYGVSVCGAGNHFYKDANILDGPHEGYHGPHEDFRQSIPNVCASQDSHGGHPFETIFQGHYNPFNLVDDNPYTVYGSRTRFNDPGSSYHDWITISFNPWTYVRKLEFTPHLPFADYQAFYIEKVEIIKTDLSTITVYNGTPGLRLDSESPITLNVSGTAGAPSNPGIPQSPAYYAAGVIIHIRSMHKLQHSGCFYWALKNIKVYGPRTTQREADVKDSGTVRIYDGQTLYINPHPQLDGEDLEYKVNFSGVTWNSVNSPPDGYTANIVSNKLVISTTSAEIDTITKGPSNGGWYSGQVSASDGVKIMVDSRGVPIPLPALPANELLENGEDEGNRVMFWIETNDSFPEQTYVGFYNKQTRRWIVDLEGNSKISWGEVITPIEEGGQGGAHNVVVAAMTWETRDRELELNEVVVPDDPTELPLLPFRWALPPFGLVKEVGSRIKLSPLPPALGKDDCWPVLVSRGHFTKEINTKVVPLAGEDESQITPQIVLPDGSLLDIENNPRIIAHYNLSEADTVLWSQLAGEPYWDVKNEMPQVVDDYTIRVKYPPIHALVLDEYGDVKDPLDIDYTDTFSPGFTDADGDPDIWYYDATAATPGWKQLTWDYIEEYDLNTGTIYLQPSSEGEVILPILSADSKLKMNYISAMKKYPFRYNDTQVVDLNPMYGHQCNIEGSLVDTLHYVNVPLYVYILPALLSRFIEGMPGDIDGEVMDGYIRSGRSPGFISTIENSFRENTLYVSTTKDIFEVGSPLYNPLAVLIGTVYINPKISVNDLAILDARRRGGGFARRLTLEECRDIYQEIDACWDLGYLTGESYPKNANITIRLPGWVQHFLAPTEVNSVIEKMVPAGILWRVEYMYGGDESA